MSSGQAPGLLTVEWEPETALAGGAAASEDSIFLPAHERRTRQITGPTMAAVFIRVLFAADVEWELARKKIRHTVEGRHTSLEGAFPFTVGLSFARAYDHNKSLVKFS